MTYDGNLVMLDFASHLCGYQDEIDAEIRELGRDLPHERSRRTTTVTVFAIFPVRVTMPWNICGMLS